jgi:hypothetical protein
MRLFFFFLILDPFDPNQLLYIFFVPLFLPFYIITWLLYYYLRLQLFLLLLFLRLFRLFDDEVHPVKLHERLREALEVRVLQARHQLKLARPQLLLAARNTCTAIAAFGGLRGLRRGASGLIADTG